jgi:hypothetical protein
VRPIVLVLLAAALLAATGASAKNPPFVGVWKGAAKTPAGNTTPVVLTVTAKLKSNNSGTIVYTAQKCTGKLAFLKQSGRVLTLRETILKGSCPKGGSIQLSQIDFRTLWAAWYAPGIADPVWTGYLLLGGR